MSPAAIDRRLREVAQLHHLGLTILKAKRIGKVGEIELEGEVGRAREALRK